jgi:hypothetical protein
MATWTQRGNDDMRALNTRLGFTTRSESIRMQAALPLALGLPAPGPGMICVAPARATEPPGSRSKSAIRTL